MLDLFQQPCELDYFEQSWTNTHKITHDSCNIKVTKRQVPGGFNLQDAQDQKYQLLLKNLATQGLIMSPQNGGDYTITQVYTQVCVSFSEVSRRTICIV